MHNAADKSQVKEKEIAERDLRKKELADVAEIASTPAGERFLRRLLAKAKTFESIWEPSAKIHYNAGQQDFGHFIMGEIVEAAPNALLRILKRPEGETNV